MAKKQENIDRLCRNALREGLRRLNVAYKGNEEKLELTGMSDICVKRRVLAHKNMVQLGIQEGAKYGIREKDAERFWANLAGYVGPSLDDINNSFDMILGASIWVLDTLRLSGKLDEALKILPRDEESLEDFELVSVIHPCYSERLLRSMCSILQDRNTECVSPKEGARDPYVFSFSDDFSMAQTQHQDNDSRNRYEQLIALLDPKAIENVVQQLKDEGIVALDLYFKGLTIIQEDIKRYSRLQLALINGMDGKGRIAEWDASPMPKKALAVELPKNKPARVKPIDQNFGMEMRLLNDAYDKNQYYNKKITDLRVLEAGWDSTLATKPLFTKGELKPASMYPDKLLKLADEFTVKNVYADCFAFLYLADHDDDFIWLNYIAAFLVSQVAASLPWNTGTNTAQAMKTEDRVQATLDGSVIPSSIFPNSFKPVYEEKGADGKLYPTSLSGLIYKKTSVLLPSYALDADTLSESLRESGVDEDTASKAASTVATLALAARQYDLPEETEDAVSKEQLQAAMDETRKLKEELATVKKQLHTAEAALKKGKEQIEEETEAFRRERQELHDLRELVFTLTNNNIPEGKEADSEIEFPYHTKKKLLVFGGHPAWLRTIKPMLPEVRFIDGIPSTEQVKGAEVIWLQTGYMSHKTFYKIIDIARAKNIPVRYFTSTSAAKCAEQLVMDESKG